VSSYVERLLAALRSALSTDAFAGAWNDGVTWSREQALAQVQTVIDDLAGDAPG
jgi:hypothetical protein